MNNLGWISINRKLLNHDIFKFSKQFSRAEAWIWLLLRANYEDKDVCIGNKIYPLKRGQMIISQLKTRKVFGWSNTRLTNFLNLLVDKGSIAYETNTKMTILTIIKYGSYQAQQHQKQTKTKSKTKQKNINNNVNKDNNVNKEQEFINQVLAEGIKTVPMVAPEIIDDFCNYWTEKNMAGKKMRYEMQPTFAIGRRLKTWLKNQKDWNINTKKPVVGFKTTTSGRYIGYCVTCNVSSFYKEYDLRGSSDCCSAEIKPKRKEDVNK